MFSETQAMTIANPFPRAPLLFAQEPDQDLEFDDSFEEGDDSRFDKKPPSRRPLVLLLALALVIGVGYSMMEPDFLSSLGGLVMSPAQTDSGEPPKVSSPDMTNTQPSSPATSFPVPRFQEGQTVAVRGNLGTPGSPIMLTEDVGGTQPGPSVRPGEFLTILDGDLRGNSWMYYVHTKSGASGWIPDQNLREKSSSG